MDLDFFYSRIRLGLNIRIFFSFLALFICLDPDSGFLDSRFLNQIFFFIEGRIRIKSNLMGNPVEHFIRNVIE